MIAFSDKKENALKRNSTFELESRELSGGARQWRGRLELASERLSEILPGTMGRRESRHRRDPAVTEGRISKRFRIR